MQKVVDFYHNEGIGGLKLGFNLPILEGICLHKSTSAMFYPFTESDKGFLEKYCAGLDGGPFIVFTRKACCEQDFYSKFEKFVQNYCRN